jgi:hypothetical protein
MDLLHPRQSRSHNEVAPLPDFQSVRPDIGRVINVKYKALWSTEGPYPGSLALASPYFSLATRGAICVGVCRSSQVFAAPYQCPDGSALGSTGHLFVSRCPQTRSIHTRPRDARPVGYVQWPMAHFKIRHLRIPARLSTSMSSTVPHTTVHLCLL